MISKIHTMHLFKLQMKNKKLAKASHDIQWPETSSVAIWSQKVIIKHVFASLFFLLSFFFLQDVYKMEDHKLKKVDGRYLEKHWQ
jgi:hypothetical protein